MWAKEHRLVARFKSPALIHGGAELRLIFHNGYSSTINGRFKNKLATINQISDEFRMEKIFVLYYARKKIYMTNSVCDCLVVLLLLLCLSLHPLLVGNF